LARRYHAWIPQPNNDVRGMKAKAKAKALNATSQVVDGIDIKRRTSHTIADTANMVNDPIAKRGAQTRIDALRAPKTRHNHRCTFAFRANDNISTSTASTLSMGIRNRTLSPAGLKLNDSSWDVMSSRRGHGGSVGREGREREERGGDEA
jgi:hypothetical protein